MLRNKKQNFVGIEGSIYTSSFELEKNEYSYGEKGFILTNLNKRKMIKPKQN